MLPKRLLKYPPVEHECQFQDLDADILLEFRRNHSLFHKRSAGWRNNARVVRSGSAALIVDINTDSLSATYANAGDCRMIVCRPFVDAQHVLLETEDLNVKTPSEKERLAKEHPGEDQIIIGERLFGKLMCTRGESKVDITKISFGLTDSCTGFGDGHYKLPRGPFGKLHKRYVDILSRIEQPGKIPMNEQYASYFYAYRSPPYVTASPESRTFQLEKGDIVILASDGLWDLVSSDELAIFVHEAVSVHRNDMAKFLLERVRCKVTPGDDITIITFKV